MIRHQRTVVLLAGAPEDRALIEYARMLAGLGFARHYHFVHVRTPARMADDPAAESQIAMACEEMISECFGSPASKATSSFHLLAGVRIDVILDFITQHRADMVLLGHRKSRSGQRSLARRLAMIAPCSVWCVPEGAPVSISGVLVPIDFSDHAADSVTVASAIARAAGLSECLALHVFSDPSMIRYDERKEEIQRIEKDSFQAFIDPIETHGVDVQPTFVEGNNVAGTILYAAKKHDSDLIVMNTRGRSRSAAILLGSVTSQVMVESRVALLAVKHYGAMMNLYQALKESHLWTKPNPKTN